MNPRSHSSRPDGVLCCCGLEGRNQYHPVLPAELLAEQVNIGVGYRLWQPVARGVVSGVLKGKKVPELRTMDVLAASRQYAELHA